MGEIDKNLVELLEFYHVDDLIWLDEQIELHMLDNAKCWEFVRNATIKDYFDTGRNPNIKLYHSLILYKNEFRNI